MAQVEVLRDAAVLIDGGRIRTVGTYRELRDAHAGAAVEEVRGVLFPGFVDCHTHAVFGGPRLDDHERRALGADYRSIAAAGGGILESVRDVRGRSEADLLALARTRLDALLRHGSTTIEVKSGYGLDVETERKRSEEHTSELQSRLHLVCRLLLEKKKKHTRASTRIEPPHQHT